MQIGPSPTPYIPQLNLGTRSIVVQTVFTPPAPLDYNPSAAPPPIGTVGIGELLVDAQSRTMWVGVDAAIDDDQALLVADIAGLLAHDEEVRTDCKAYTDTQIQTRAPTVHTHTASQITDFEAAVKAVSVTAPSTIQKGMIMLWSGSLSDIGKDQTPSGGANLLDWVLCDGSPGTSGVVNGLTIPNLTEKFILGAGTRAPGPGTAGGVNFNTADAGAHTPVCNNHTLTLAEIPAHKHGLNDPGHIHSITDPGHSHPVPQGGGGSTFGPGLIGTCATQAAQTATARTTGITIKKDYTDMTMDNAGSGGGHGHVMQAVPNHSHVVSAAAVLACIPFYLLAYIIKVR